MNWLQLPQLVMLTMIGIQQMHKDAGTPGTTKKQLVLEGLGLAGTVAGNLLTGTNGQLATAAATMASNLVDQFATIFKANSLFGFTPSLPTSPVANPVLAPPAVTK